MRYKDLKKQNKELQDKLNIANKTIFEHFDKMNKVNKAFDKMEEHYNSHMQIAENEIKRLNVIIHYLEGKVWKEQ